MNEKQKSLLNDALQKMREAHAKIVFLGLMTKLRLRAMREKGGK